MGSLFDRFKGSPKGPAGGTRENDRTDAGPSQPDMPPASREAIIAALKGHLETVWSSEGKPVEPADFSPDEDLYETGYVDSLSAAQFLLLAEKQYGIKLPDWLLGGRAKSLAALADYIGNELARRRS